MNAGEWIDVVSDNALNWFDVFSERQVRPDIQGGIYIGNQPRVDNNMLLLLGLGVIVVLALRK